MNSRILSKTNIVLAALFLPVIAWLSPLFFPENLALFPGIDGAFYFYPMTTVGMDMFRHGEVPLWTSLIHSGFPLLADGQGALLYPLNLLFFLTLPPHLANNYCIALQVLLTTAFMYAFCRSLAISRMPSVVASWIWVIFGPVAMSWGSPALNGIIWWPLLFLLADRCARGLDLPAVAMAGTVMGFGWLGGFPQTTIYGIAAASMYFMVRLISRHHGRLKAAAAPLSGWIIAGVIGGCLAAPQLLPTFEMSQFSIRSGKASLAFASLGSMFPTGFMSFLLPNWTMLFDYSLAGSNLHIGFICLAAALLTIRKKMAVLDWFLWFLVIAGGILAMGKYTPLYSFVNAIPGFSFFRYPYRYLYWTSFAIAVLAALGLDRVISPTESPVTLRRRMAAIILALTGAAVLAGTLGTMLFHAARDRVYGIVQSVVNKSLAGQAYKLQDADYYSAKINRMMTDIASALSLGHSGIILSCVIALVAAIILAFLFRKAATPRNVKIALFLLVAVNTAALVHAPLGPMSRTADFQSFPMASLCRDATGPSRLYNVTTSAEVSDGSYFKRERLDPNFNMLAGIDHTGVYSALGTKRYFDLLSPIGTVNLAFAVQSTSAAAVEQHRPLLDLLNVGYVAAKDPLTIPGLEQVRGETPFLYKNTGALPRAYVVPRAVTVANDSAMLDSLHSPLFDPRAAVLIEKDPGPDASAGGGAYSVAPIQSEKSGRVVMKATGPGWLVFSETFYPGWTAKVNGTAVEIRRGNYCFKTLPLGAGDHTVEFSYQCRPFGYGLIIMSITLAIVIFLIVFGAQLTTHRRK